MARAAADARLGTRRFGAHRHHAAGAATDLSSRHLGGPPVPALRRARVLLAALCCELGGLAISGCGSSGGLTPDQLPAHVDSVGINLPSATLLVGDSTPVTARVAAQNGAPTTVTWQSSDATKARV